MSFDRDTRVINILKRIAGPTAPFHEGIVAERITETLKSISAFDSVNFYDDEYGNMIYEYNGNTEDKLPAIAFMAHMDHPGMEITHVGEGKAEARIIGGLPLKKLPGMPVQVESHAGEWIPGVVDSVLIGKGRDNRKAFITLQNDKQKPALHGMAVPDFPDFALKEETIEGRAMDDLAGCAIQAAVFEKIVEEHLNINAYAVFHRAEETGFLGACALAETGIIRKDALIVSIEASKQMKGVKMNQGIVIREGDKICWFDRNVEAYLTKGKEIAESAGFKIQKARMTGGTCESTIYHAHGYETTAVALPLLNYHNEGPVAPAPEIIGIYDINSGVELLINTARFISEKNRYTKLKLKEDKMKRFNLFADKLKKTAPLIGMTVKQN